MELVPEISAEERADAERKIDEETQRREAESTAKLAELERTGGPAYPTSKSILGMTVASSDGLTIRDYFAGNVVYAVAAMANQSGVPENLHPDAIAAECYRLADAMIAARKAAARG